MSLVKVLVNLEREAALGWNWTCNIIWGSLTYYNMTRSDSVAPRTEKTPPLPSGWLHQRLTCCGFHPPGRLLPQTQTQKPTVEWRGIVQSAVSDRSQPSAAQMLWRNPRWALVVHSESEWDMRFVAHLCCGQILECPSNCATLPALFYPLSPQPGLHHTMKELCLRKAAKLTRFPSNMTKYWWDIVQQTYLQSFTWYCILLNVS